MKEQKALENMNAEEFEKIAIKSRTEIKKVFSN